MQTSQKHPTSAGIHLYHQPAQDIDPYTHYQILQSNSCHEIHDNSSSQGTTISFETSKDQYFTLESSPVINDLIGCDSPSYASVSSNRSGVIDILIESVRHIGWCIVGRKALWREGVVVWILHIMEAVPTSQIFAYHI